MADTALGAVVAFAVIAVANEHHPSAGGFLLAAFAASSVLPGPMYGAREWRMPPEWRLVALMLWDALAYVVLTARTGLLCPARCWP